MFKISCNIQAMSCGSVNARAFGQDHSCDNQDWWDEEALIFLCAPSSIKAALALEKKYKMFGQDQDVEDDYETEGPIGEDQNYTIYVC